MAKTTEVKFLPCFLLGILALFLLEHCYLVLLLFMIPKIYNFVFFTLFPEDCVVKNCFNLA